MEVVLPCIWRGCCLVGLAYTLLRISQYYIYMCISFFPVKSRSERQSQATSVFKQLLDYIFFPHLLCISSPAPPLSQSPWEADEH